MYGQHLLVGAIAGLTPSAMVSAEAGGGEGYGPVAVPVFKTELRGVSCADGSTPSLLRHFPVTGLVRIWKLLMSKISLNR